MDKSLQAFHPKGNPAESVPSSSGKGLHPCMLQAQSGEFLPHGTWHSMERSAPASQKTVLM